MNMTFSIDVQATSDVETDIKKELSEKIKNVGLEIMRKYGTPVYIITKPIKKCVDNQEER